MATKTAVDSELQVNDDTQIHITKAANLHIQSTDGSHFYRDEIWQGREHLKLDGIKYLEGTNR